MTLPRQIPAGARVVVRITDGIDPVDHRMKFRDYVGHAGFLGRIHVGDGA